MMKRYKGMQKVGGRVVRMPYMVRYEVERNEGGIVTYSYFPDGDREHPEKVAVGVCRGEISSVAMTAADPLGRCLTQTVGEISRMLSDGQLRESGSLSWG